MTKTTPVFVLRYGDSVAMKDGSAFASTSTHAASDLTNLVNGDGNKHLLYATYEPDSWLLDGRSKFLPDNSTKAGFVSDVISDVNGDFSSPILLTITLDTTYTFEQLIRFSFSEISGDYCTELKVEYRNASDTLIDDETYFPTTYEYRAELPAKPIANVKYIRVYFYSTNRPYRHLRLIDIGFDDILFRGSEIKSATIVEEISRYSTELKSNSLDVSLFSPTGEFSVVSTTGMFSGLEENQPADMYEEIDGVTNYMGRFYLDKFDSPTPNKMNLSLKDGISLLDKSKYLGGFWNFDLLGPVEIYSDDLIAEIMSAADLNYELDAELENIEMNGVLHIGSCRKALQQVLFSLGAYATCSRSNKILIHKAQLSTDIVTPDYELDPTQKGISQSVELKPLITSLDLFYSEYAIDESVHLGGGNYTNIKKIFDGSLALGTHVIDLYPDIANTFIGSGGATAVVTIDSTSVARNTYLLLTCTTAGTWNYSIFGFIRNKKWAHTVSLAGVTDKNKVTIKDGEFISVHNYSNLADELFDYMQERYIQNVRLYATTIKPGDSVLVDTYDGKQIQGIVEKVKTDLARGFISDVEIVGVLL
mgnify:CR=1 FL=1